MKQAYVYFYRPEYGGSNLLIEFFRGAEHDDFLNDLFEALSAIHPQVESVMDLWMYDELMMNLKSDLGEFELSKDTWGFAFIMTKTNQDGLRHLESIISKNEKFLREEVDYQKYA